jgi:Tol biopolymer transport system component
VNTPFRDYSPRISPDGQYLFFTSEKDWSVKKHETPYTYNEVTSNFRTVLNGSGNIYEIKLSALGIVPPQLRSKNSKH